MTSLTKRTVSFITIILTFLMAVFMAFDASASVSYKNWIQSDPAWGSKTLGNSDETMAQVGCAVTSVAMLAVHSGSVSQNNFDPGVLCDFLSRNGGFDNYANIYWGAVSNLVPDLTYQKKVVINSGTESGVAAEIASYIDQGYYLVLSVNYDTHWIAVDTVSNGNVYIMDPAQSSIKNLFDKYSPSGITQAKLYKGKNKPAKTSLVNTNNNNNTNNNTSNSNTQTDTQKYLTGHYRTVSALNFRSSYSTSSNVIEVIPKGKDIVVTRVCNEWGQIEYNGKTGWICLEYTLYTEGLYSYRLGLYRTAESLYMRKDVGTDKEAVCVLPKGTVISIMYVKQNWGRVFYNDNSGFVCMEYLSYIGDIPVITTANTTAPTKTVTTVTTVAVNKTTSAAAKTTPVTSKAVTVSTVPEVHTDAVVTSSKKAVSAIIGDLNNSKDITKEDLILLNEYIAQPYTISAAEKRIMDINGDGVIDARDSVYLLKIINIGN